MRFLVCFFICFSCYSQQQLLPMILDEDAPPAPSFNGEFQFLFNNNTNEETGNHTPSATGTYSYIAGPNAYNGQAISCNGTQYIDLPADAAFSTVNFTVSFWFRRATFQSSFNTIFEHNRFGSNWYAVYTRNATGILRIKASNAAAPNNQDTPTSFSTNTWHHVVVSYDGTDITAYVDGVGVLDQPANPGTANLAAIRLLTNADDTEGYVGDIDRIEYWNEEKNASEASDIYDCATDGTNCNN